MGALEALEAQAAPIPAAATSATPILLATLLIRGTFTTTNPGTALGVAWQQNIRTSEQTTDCLA